MEALEKLEVNIDTLVEQKENNKRQKTTENTTTEANAKTND